MSRRKLPDKDFDWSPKLAYAVGLIATDGNLSPDGRHIIFKSADKQLVSTLKNCLEIKNGIYKEKGANCFRIQFGNVQFYKWLQKIGISPAKSLTLGKIDMSDKYFRDFLRGHLDGDGSIILYNDRYNSYKGRTYNNLRTYIYFLSASRQRIEWLQENIYRLTGIRGALIKRTYKDTGKANIYYIKIARYESAKMLKWLYYKTDLPCLTRKRKTAQRALSLAKKWERKIYKFI